MPKLRHPQIPIVTVVGSINLDWISQVPRLPKPGETISSTNLIQRFGGKGANQAIAASKLGTTVNLIGGVGDDDIGSSYLHRLQSLGIEARGIRIQKKTHTGSAMIAVDTQGENHIIVNSGANGRLSANQVRLQDDLMAQANVLLLQLETPLPAVLEALRLAQQHRIPVVLNPSPILPDFPWGKYPIHSLIVNEGEAQILFGKSLSDPKTPLRIQKTLEKRSINRLIVTRGSAPTQAYLLSGAQLEVPTIQIQPVDTVGAGDAFAGAYAAALAKKHELSYCLQYANTAAALATLKSGAQEALPTHRQVLKTMKEKFLLSSH